VDPSPHTSTSRPPDVIHVTGVPRPSPFFALFRFRVLYWTKTEEQKTGGGLGTRLSFHCVAVHKLLVGIICYVKSRVYNTVMNPWCTIIFSLFCCGHRAHSHSKCDWPTHAIIGYESYYYTLKHNNCKVCSNCTQEIYGFKTAHSSLQWIDRTCESPNSNAPMMH